MKRIFVIFLLFCGTLAALLAISFFAPLAVPYLQDFSVMYFTDRALLHGIPIYDFPAQLSFVRALTAPNFIFHPYPYPPWYALFTLPLGLLPIQAAARLWFFLNIAMLCASAWLLTPAWLPIRRILGLFAALIFIPAFGLLVVGQYSAPVLLGAALFPAAIQRKSAFWAAVSLLLMTFKPHIGGLLFLAGFGWLVYEKLSFARRAILFTTAGLIILMGLGFLADPRWPLTYLQSLGRYRDIPGVQTCGLCASLSVALVKLVTGQSNTFVGAGVGLALLLAFCGLIFWRYRSWLMQPFALMAISSVLTLLVDPYLLNYDYILLLVPLFWLAQRSERCAWLAYFLPWLALALGREGNILLVLAGIVTFILIFRQPIDVPASQAYNQNLN